jgi:hypothetical protein
MNGATRWCRKGSSRNARASSCQKLLPKIEPIAVYDLLQKGFPFGVADHAIQSRIDRVLDARSAKNTARFGHLILIQLNRCPCHHEHSVPSDGRDMYQYPKVCVPGDGWAWPTSEVDFSVSSQGLVLRLVVMKTTAKDLAAHAEAGGVEERFKLQMCNPTYTYQFDLETFGTCCGQICGDVPEGYGFANEVAVAA